MSTPPSFPSFGWLHLSDLSLSLRSTHRGWKLIREPFFRDIERLHGLMGPFHLVVLTGDLTRSGQPEEFAHLEDVLTEVWSFLLGLGSSPRLAIVPGDCDVSPVLETDPRALLINDYEEDSSLQDEIWTKPTSPYMELIRERFSGYLKWLRNTSIPLAGELDRGAFPGDFSTVVNVQGVFSVGIIGLNSAALHAPRNPSQAVLDVRQLWQVTQRDPSAWLRHVDLSLLITHHPPEMMSEKSRRQFGRDILGEARFAAHLSGPASTLAPAISDQTGRAPIVRPFLDLGDGDNGRTCGYSAGRIEVRESTVLRFWPRILKGGSPGFRFVPDHDAILGADFGTPPTLIQRNVVTKVPSFEDFGPPVGNIPETPVIARAAELDREFFLRHPHEKKYLRTYIPGEFGDEIGAERFLAVNRLMKTVTGLHRPVAEICNVHAVEVTQLEPGVRSRRLIASDGMELLYIVSPNLIPVWTTDYLPIGLVPLGAKAGVLIVLTSSSARDSALGEIWSKYGELTSISQVKSADSDHEIYCLSHPGDKLIPNTSIGARSVLFGDCNCPVCGAKPNIGAIEQECICGTGWFAFFDSDHLLVRYVIMHADPEKLSELKRRIDELKIVIVDYKDVLARVIKSSSTS